MLSQVQKPFWNVSFSGAGHLLAYHLGAARVLLGSGHPIGAVSGSSSGAIAAAVVSLFPHRLEEFTDTFLRDRGRALTSFKKMLIDEGVTGTSASRLDDKGPNSRPMLVVAATDCKDGSLKIFTFDPATIDESENISEDILRAIQASCTIPVSFHPFDMFRRSSVSYSDEEGVEIAGGYFVDGGIAAPVPPTPLDSESAATKVIVSPISGSYSSEAAENNDNSKLIMIRPNDNTFALPGGDWTARCGAFRIRPSIQNLRSMIASLGVANVGVLEDWHRRGVNDAQASLEHSKSLGNKSG